MQIVHGLDFRCEPVQQAVFRICFFKVLLLFMVMVMVLVLVTWDFPTDCPADCPMDATNKKIPLPFIDRGCDIFSLLAIYQVAISFSSVSIPPGI